MTASIDRFLSYKTKLFEKTDLTLRFDVRNICEDNGYFGRDALDDGMGNPYHSRL